MAVTLVAARGGWGPRGNERARLACGYLMGGASGGRAGTSASRNVEKGSKFFVDGRSEGGLTEVLTDVVGAHTVRVRIGHTIPQG